MNRLLSIVVSLLCGVVVCVGLADLCAACPPVAVAQAGAVSPLVIPQAVAIAPAQPLALPASGAQAVAGFGYALPSAIAVAQPLAIAQPVALTSLGVVANAGCVGGACARASVRTGVGGRRMLLPRQRAVSRVVVR